MSFISVIIPTYKRKASLSRCLTSLLNQTYLKENYEVLVVEDGSYSGVEEIVKDLKKDLGNFYYFWQKHKGPAAARNLGIKKAKGEVVAFLDDDCVAPSDWLEKLVKAYKRFPDVVGVGGFMEAAEEILKKNIFSQYESYLTRKVYKAGKKEVLGGFEVPTGGTNNISYKKSILERIGGFDESFPVAAGEDADLKKRISDKGFKILYIPVKVEHHHRYNLASFARQNYNRGIGSVYFQKKHGGGWGRLILLKHIFLLPLVFVKDIFVEKLNLKIAFFKMLAGFFDSLAQLTHR